jgi:hypothetical protein
MRDNTTIALIGLVFGIVFLVLAYASTVSKVTLSVFNPWLGRQIRHGDQPRTFMAVVLLYWLMGAAGVVFGLVSLLSAT